MGLKKETFWRLLLIISTASLFVALWAKPIPAQDNVLLNPGFENVPPGQDPALPPWWEWNSKPEDSKSLVDGEVTDEIVYSGSRSAVRYVKGKAIGCYAQNIKIVAGEVIEAGVWIRTSKNFSDAQAYLRIEFKDKDYEIIQAIESKKIISADESWKLYTLKTSPAPKGAMIAVFCLFIEGNDRNSSGKAWFDDGYLYIKVKGLI